MNDKIHSLKLGYSNAFCIKSKNSLCLVDTGLKNNLAKIEKLLQQKGIQLKDIDIILITHAHPDHVGSLAELALATDAQIWAHSLEAAIMRGEELIQNANTSSLSPIGRSLQTLLPKPESMNFRVDRELQDAEILTEILAMLEVVHLPGHTKGQIGLWHRDTKTLIGGDVMMHIANRLTMPLRAFSSDWEETKKSIIKVANMQPNNLYLGHGSPIIGNTQKPLQNLLNRISNN